MPHSEADKPNRDRIDWTMAVILERKKAMKLSWTEIADEVGMSPQVLRNLVCYRPTKKWPKYTLRKVCQALGIVCGTYTIRIPEGKK